jgi:hypothetical protein
MSTDALAPIVSIHQMSMQAPPPPTEDDDAPIPPEIVSSSSPNMAASNDDSNMIRTVEVCRKAAKRTLPWDQAAGELDLMPSSWSPQAEDIPVVARKKPRRMEEPFSGSTDEAARNTASPDVSEGHSHPANNNYDANADADAETQPNTVATGRWTLEEDAKLTSAVANTSKKKWGKEYKIDWAAVAALVLGRTSDQCYQRWDNFLDSSTSRATGSEGKWAEDEDSKLKDAVQMHGGKNWFAISALVPGRTKIQCRNRWHNALDPSIGRANGRTGKWTPVEDSKLKDAVQTHGCKNWAAISALVSCRTKIQCSKRWHDALTPSIALAPGCSGKWAEDEDRKLKDAVQTHGDRDWVAVAALVPGRTKGQCRQRWHNALNPSIALTAGRTGKWSGDEDIKLKAAVRTHGGKNWDSIAALVPGRARLQCRNRFTILVSNIDRSNGRSGK